MEQFEILLKNEKLSSYNRISWIIIITNCLLIFYLSFFSTERDTGIIAVITLILLGIIFLLKFYFKKGESQTSPAPFFILLIFSWLIMQQYWLALFTFFFDLLNIISTRKLVAVFIKDKIIYPSFPKKTIDWGELNGVILKDNILTIDFKNNKLIQQMVDENSFSINEAEFNDFCREQLKRR